MKNLALSLTFFPYLFLGQLIDNREGNAFTETPFFNPTFIQTSKIKCLHAKIFSKSKNDIIRLTADELIYHFDTLGNLIQIESIRKIESLIRKSTVCFKYDSNRKLTETTKEDGVNLFVTGLRYDSLGRIVKKTINRQSIPTTATQHTAAWEEIKYCELENGFLKKFFDENANEFKEQIIIEQADGRIIEMEKWKMSTEVVKKEYCFLFNELVSVAEYQHGNEQASEENCFSYTTNGELTAKDLLKNGVFITEWQIIYDQQTKLLSALIIQDKKTAAMEIFKFKAIYF